MKKLTVSMFALFAVLAFGQEKEIKAAFSAYDSGNKAQAQTLIQQADAAVGNKAQSIDPDVYAKYLYVKGNSLLEQGKTVDGAKVLSELTVYEKGPVYSLKNKETKEKAYVLSKDEAAKLQAQGFSGLKETTSGTTYSQKSAATLDAKRQEVAKKAADEYVSKQFASAGNDFLEAYYLFKAAGGNDDIYKYYAAVSYNNDEQNDKALELYKELINDGYTGVNIKYTAKDKDGQEVNMDATQYQLFQKANAGYTDFKQETTPSVEPDLYHYAVQILINDKKYDDALNLTQKGLAKLPNDQALNDVLGDLYYQTGQTDKFAEKLQEQLQKDPNDYKVLYNLGFLYSKDPATTNKAKEYYEKAIQAKPDYTDAYLNLAILLMQPDKELVNQMKNLGTSTADNKKYDALFEQRKQVLGSALPYLEKAYRIDSSNIAVIGALRDVYRVLGNRAKMQEMDAILLKK
ncbi:MAG: hypothetical protein LBT29_00245 [Flavobacteriaceae bacterium]|jgi:tetratricopeptide (TPR) repeat protein|nr:hypothetical protein [Flavobacteriaceae bacterium]